MNNIVIEASNLSKEYRLYDCPLDRLKETLNPFKKSYHRKFQALENTNLQITKGETVGILGPNGAGKSTLLKIITGVLTPTKGTVTVVGKIASLLELGAGFNPEMTGIENIYLNGAIMGFSTKEIDEKLDDIIAFADIGDFIDQPVKLYSSGMFARLAFSVSINVEPSVLIVDEVLSVGDSRFKRKCFARMEQMRDQGITIIFVTHAENLINEICTRAILMNEGEIIIDGLPKIVTSLYRKYSNRKKSWNIEMLKKEFVKIEKSFVETILNKEGKTKALEMDNIDQSIIPQTPICYNEEGAKIIEPEIETIDGIKVNILEQGKNYVYSYTVIFEHEFKHINFGMLIKTVSGLELGGGTFPGQGKYLYKINKGRYRVSWQFTASLNQATYFLNAGVHAKLDSEESAYIARALDHYAFKITQCNPMATAYINFINKCTINEIN